MPELTLAGIVELEPPPTPSHSPSVQTQGVINPLTPNHFHSVLPVMANACTN